MSEKHSQHDFSVALIGCGVIGERRLEMIERLSLGRIRSVYDLDGKRASRLALRFGAEVASDPLELSGSDAVVVATPNHCLAEYGVKALQAGKHVLIEKPGAVSLNQMKSLAEASSQLSCKIGYNLRFHPAAQAIHQEISSGNVGQMLWIRAAYGHGGRPGYEKEWRFDPLRSGGGEIIDQGVHLLDLIQWWSGDRFYLCAPIRQNAFYRAEVEDNGFLTLVSERRVVAQLHCSATQWKNLFRMEIATQQALFVWDGLGGSYGEETLTTHRRNPAGGAPHTTSQTFAGASEQSWENEWRHFVGHMTGSERKLFSRPEESLWIFEVLEEAHESTNLHC